MIVLDQNICEKKILNAQSVEKPRFMFLKDYPGVEILSKTSLLKKYPPHEPFYDRIRIVGLKRKVYSLEQNVLLYDESLYGDYCIVTKDNSFIYLALWLNSPWGLGELLDYDFHRESGSISMMALKNVIIPYINESSAAGACNLYAIELLGVMALSAKNLLETNPDAPSSLLETAGYFFSLVGYYALMEILLPHDFRQAGIEILKPWCNIVKGVGYITPEKVGESLIKVITDVLTTNNELRINVNKMKFFSSRFKLKLIDQINEAYDNLKK